MKAEDAKIIFTEAENEFECVHFDITDEFLDKAKIVAYMFDQTIENSDGEDKPFNPKTFPEKAVDIIVYENNDNIVDIFLDSNTFTWDSKLKVNGKLGKLGPDQMEQFFESDFYRRMLNSLSQKWPLSDPTFRRYFDACVHKKMFSDDVMRLDEIDQPEKRKDLANKDITGDGKRDYSATGRKIQTFGDMGVKGGSGLYYCWPNQKYPFKWSQWKDWTKIKPLCKMTFVHNNRKYGISLSLFDENFENRGFRGADYDWEPPLAWLTPGECAQVMKLNIVKKFVRQCIKRIIPFIRMKPEEIYEKVNNPEKISIEEIRKTQRVIKGVVGSALRKNQADTYCWN